MQLAHFLPAHVRHWPRPGPCAVHGGLAGLASSARRLGCCADAAAVACKLVGFGEQQEKGMIKWSGESAELAEDAVAGDRQRS